MATPRNQKKVVISSLLLLIIIIPSCEFIFRGLETGGIIGEPYDWGNRNVVALKINDGIKVFNQNLGKFRIVAVGNSLVEMGLNPFQLDSLFGNKTITVNVGIPQTAIPFQSVFIQKVIFKWLKPDLIIWDVRHEDFWDWVPLNEEENAILSTPMGRYHTGNMSGLNFDELVNQFLIQYSFLYRYRAYLVPPIFEFSPYYIELTSQYQRGFWPQFENNLKTNYTGIIDRPGQDVEAEGFPVYYNDRAEKQFNETLSFIQTNGADYLVLYGPFMHFHYVFPRLDALFATLPPEKFLDVNGNESLMADELYYNFGHLNVYGSQILTGFVFDKLKDRITPLLEP